MQKLKLNVHKYKGLKTEHENSKLGHYMKGFILKQEISLIVNQKKKKEVYFICSFRYTKAR